MMRNRQSSIVIVSSPLFPDALPVCLMTFLSLTEIIKLRPRSKSTYDFGQGDEESRKVDTPLCKNFIDTT
jgi:hypothetical protein